MCVLPIGRCLTVRSHLRCLDLAAPCTLVGAMFLNSCLEIYLLTLFLIVCSINSVAI